MEVKLTTAPLAEIEADAVVVGLGSSDTFRGPAAAADDATGGLLRRLMMSQEISGKPYEITPLLAAPGVRAGQLLLVGLGEPAALDATTAYRAAAAATRHLAARPRAAVALLLADALENHLGEAVVCGAMSGCRGQDLYRAEKKRHPIETLLVGGVRQNAIDAGRVVGDAVNLARTLVNEPAQSIYPESFAWRAEDVAQELGLELEVWDPDRLEQERCGSLLAVARGSARPPRLVILTYRGGQAEDPLLALAGKGVTFDSGGLSLKPSESMLTMKCDMAGAAAVLAAIAAIARLKLPVNVMGLMGLVENMTGPEAYKLGDVLTARNGRTIEVHNTDAEGRLVLADVLCVAVDRGAAKIIDVATLTGACMVALGTDVAGLMTNDQSWCDLVAQAARACGEPVWQLPMFEQYDELIKSEVADIKNVGEGRWAGAITAAKLLEQFVARRPWTHIDIAGPAFVEKPKPWTDGGASGCMVRTLVEVARRWR